ncbi:MULTISPECIES: ankyrin repeat domain-containing protein [Streptomyces]|uniref:Ankyrin repeat domain-containing protein n=1 Tax=Streptomyces celluloflavus TaxID=58344 RepID=A0ABW7RIR8_9ACTN|nr:ankyrin repeat domain-containing protein [Streptomyces kasugaensis]
MSNLNASSDHLRQAALRGDGAEIEALLSSGADVNAGDANGFTALHLAAQECQVNAARVLLEGGAFVDQKNRFGNTPLFVAVFNSRGRGEMIKLLRSNGADPGAENGSGQTPLGLARLIANHDVKIHFLDLE